jgi:hypothetical protein
MTLTGKGFYIWKVKTAQNGDPAAITAAAQAAGLSHVIIKVADGIYNYNITGGVDMVPPLVAALRSAGIQPWGWQYVYGNNPVFEAHRAIERIQQLGLAGFVVDAEAQFKVKGMDKVAKKYMQELRRGLPNTPIALSTYRFPTVHYAFPFSAFLEYCDLNMPQVYWVSSYNAAQQLRKSYSEYQAIKPWRTFLPTGAAYAEGNWSPSPLQINDFMNAARDLQLPGANFWEWGDAAAKPELWDAVKNYSWPAPAPDPAQQPGDDTPQPAPQPAPQPDANLEAATELAVRYISALNSGDPSRVVQLYDKADCKLIYAGQTKVGRVNINGWFNTFLKKSLPKAHFSLLDAGVQDKFFKVVWKAKSGNGRSVTGSDLFRMSNANPSLISLHYINFSIGKQGEKREKEMVLPQ